MKSSALVVGKDLAAALAPFERQLQVPEYEVEVTANAISELERALSLRLKSVDPQQLQEIFSENFDAISVRRDGDRYFKRSVAEPDPIRWTDGLTAVTSIASSPSSRVARRSE